MKKVRCPICKKEREISQALFNKKSRYGKHDFPCVKCYRSKVSLKSSLEYL